MKIIDEQGRLFGKINLIDFLVILFLFSFISMFYFGYKLFSTSRPKVSPTDMLSASKQVSIDVYGVIKNLTSEKIKLISVGDKCFEKGQTIGEILAISTPEINVDSVDFGGGKTLLINDPLRRQVFIKARLNGELKDNIFYCRGERINIGSKILFNTEKYSVYLNITFTEESETVNKFKKQYFPQPEPVELNVLIKPIDLDIVKIISIGDSLIDESGNNVGVILEIGEPSIYSYAIDLGQGNVVGRNDPRRRQLPAKVRISGQIKDNLFYYGGEKVILGSKIVIRTNKYQAEGIIDSEPKMIYRENILLKVRFTNLMPEVANIIKIGDESKNEDGETVAVVKSIVIKQPSRIMIQDGKQMVFIDHPLNRDVTLLIDFHSIKEGNKLIFKKNALKIGSSMLFSSKTYDMNGTIVWIVQDE